MPELEDSKRTKRNKETSTISKKLNAIPANTLREIVSIANSLELNKEDIVTIMKDNNQFFIIYFK